MNHNFDARDKFQPFPPDADSGAERVQGAEVDTALCAAPDCLDNLKRDRFEMISAYLDGEGSAEERRQVECWLQSDATVQHLYTRLLRLRDGIQAMPTPVSSVESVEQTIDSVFARLDAEQAKTISTVPFSQAELLSAYLDGEVSNAERRQVERWLAQDPVLQRLYAQMQRMQRAVQTLPVPEAAAVPADVMVERVLARVQRRRTKRAWVWGGVAAAAIAGVLTTFVAGINGPTLRFATNSTEEAPSTSLAVSDDALMIALDQPIIEIPKVPEDQSRPQSLVSPAGVLQDVQ